MFAAWSFRSAYSFGIDTGRCHGKVASYLPGIGYRTPAMTTALLIIDVQHALCTGDEAAFEIDAVIERINALVAAARATSVPVILIQHEDAEGSLRFGADGWQLADGLAAHPDDLRVRKTTPDSFHQTELYRLLLQREVTDLVVCGLQSDFCVDTTVRRALALDYHVTLVADAHSTVDNGVLAASQITAHHNATFRNMTSFGPRIDVIPTRDVRIGIRREASA